MKHLEDWVGEREEVQKREGWILVYRGKYYITSQTYEKLLILVRELLYTHDLSLITLILRILCQLYTETNLV